MSRRAPLVMFLMAMALAVAVPAQEMPTPVIPPAPAGAGSLSAPQWMTLDWLQRQESVRIAWHPVEGAFGYRIYRAPAEWGDLERIGSTKNLRWFDEGTAPGAVYRYAIAAYVDETEGPLSEVRPFVVPGGEPIPVETPGEIAPPEWVLSAGFLDTSGPSPAFRVQLVWLPPAIVGIVGYNVYRNPESGLAGVFLGATPAMQTRFLDRPPWEPGRTWYYSVRAVGPGFRQSDPSPERAVTLAARGTEGAIRGRLADHEAELLGAILLDEDPFVSRAAAQTLADAEPSDAVIGILAGALTGGMADREVRRIAVTGLSRTLGSPPSTEGLAPRGASVLAVALQDPDPEVAAAARSALTGIVGADLGDDPAAWLEWFSLGPAVPQNAGETPVP